jgi:Uma2 family endonuclease
MSELREKVNILEGYPYHLPDKPLPPGPYISYEEFLDWADEDTLAEWVDGAIEMSSPANWNHQRTANFLNQVLSLFVEVFELGIVIPPPFQMKLSGKKESGREPDLLFLAKANLGRLENGLVRGPGDLAVEVVSPESQERDRVTKFHEYRLGGVPEYWLLDPDQQQADFYRLTIQGSYRSQPLDPQGRYYSAALPGFWLKPAWLWLDPLPSSQDVLKLIGGETYTAFQNRPPRADL